MLAEIRKDIPLPNDDEEKPIWKKYGAILDKLNVGESVLLSWDAALYYYVKLSPKRFINRDHGGKTRFWRTE